jgi:hypothetical protein
MQQLHCRFVRSALAWRGVSAQDCAMAQYSFLTPALTALLLTATPPAAQEFRPIDTADDFAVQVTGKTLRWATGETIIRADGTTSGSMQNVGSYEGVWSWRDGYYCRSLVVNGDAGEEKCLSVEIAGDTLRMSYDRGAGRSLDLTISDN